MSNRDEMKDSSVRLKTTRGAFVDAFGSGSAFSMTCRALRPEAHFRTTLTDINDLQDVNIDIGWATLRSASSIHRKRPLKVVAVSTYH